MPNWCENDLSIRGSKKDVINFLETAGYDKSCSVEDFIENTALTLRCWMPMPETYEKMDTTNAKRQQKENESDEDYQKYCEEYDAAVKFQKETYGAVGWYNYNLMTLGTKWDAQINEYGMSSYDGSGFIQLNFSFLTAWCPPDAWLKTLIKEYPNLTFDLGAFEPGNAFTYHLVGSNGAIDLEMEDTYSPEEDEENEEEEVLI